MESATLGRAAPRSGLVQVGVVVVLLGLAALAWVLTDDRMGGMDAGPGTDLGGLGWFLVGWVAMMGAMMFPSIAPMVSVYAGEARSGRTGPAHAAATVLFVAGYLAAWAGIGLLGYALIESVRSLDLGFLAWDEGGPYVAGAIILGAAVYQLTPLKDTCLRHCRTPEAFVREHWRPGGFGALRMGADHGVFCIGCCWALMAALFALGVMSLGWMFFVAALIAAEKLLPWREVANRGVAAILAVVALGVAFVPEDVPGLTIPGSSEAAQAMESMEMEGSMEPAGGEMEESMSPAAPPMEDGSMAPEGGSMGSGQAMP